MRSRLLHPPVKQRNLGAAMTLSGAAIGSAYVGLVSWFWVASGLHLLWLSPLYFVTGIFCADSWRMTKGFLKGDIILKSAGRRWLAAHTILVVEDDCSLRDSIAQYLEWCGFNVVQADTGMAAVDQIKQHPQLDLVFTDVVMPGVMDGVALAAWIATHHPHLIVMAASDDPNRFDAIRTLCGPYAFQKPYDLRHIAGKMHEALSARFALPSDTSR